MFLKKQKLVSETKKSRFSHLGFILFEHLLPLTSVPLWPLEIKNHRVVETDSSPITIGLVTMPCWKRGRDVYNKSCDCFGRAIGMKSYI